MSSKYKYSININTVNAQFILGSVYCTDRKPKYYNALLIIFFVNRPDTVQSIARTLNQDIISLG